MQQLDYHIQGLCDSHSAVLRSMILLTEKSLDCAWKASPEHNAAVLFLGASAEPDNFGSHPGQILISVGNCAQKQSLHLDLPLLFPRVAKLLASVTQAALAEQAQRQQDHASLQPSVFNLDFLPPNAKHDDIPVSGQLYKLKTWPPAGIIGSNRSYMRAAAVLTGKSLTSSQLAEKTNLPLGDCRQFIGKLGGQPMPRYHGSRQRTPRARLCPYGIACGCHHRQHPCAQCRQQQRSTQCRQRQPI